MQASRLNAPQVPHLKPGREAEPEPPLGCEPFPEPALCPPSIIRIPCGWRTNLTRGQWLRANRSVRVPWQVCFAPGSERARRGKAKAACSAELTSIKRRRTAGSKAKLR